MPAGAGGSRSAPPALAPRSYEPPPEGCSSPPGPGESPLLSASGGRGPSARPCRHPELTGFVVTDQAARARIRAVLRRAGLTPPPSALNAPPVVVWRHLGCSRTVLRVFWTPAGYTALGERFSEPPDQWAGRTGISVESAKASAYPHVGDVNGIDRLLPHDLDAWGNARFEVGCASHFIGSKSVDLVKADVQEFLATRRVKNREVAKDGVS